MAVAKISHDKLFKTVFKEFLKDLVELVHPELAARLDLDQIRFVDNPVISLVVFLHGGKPGLEIREVKRRVGPFEPTCYRYLAFGLSGSLAEEYVGRPQPLAAGLAALMRSRTWDKAGQKVRCLRAIGQAKDLDDKRRYLMVKIVETYLQLDEIQQERFEAEMEQEVNKEALDMVVTWEEALAEREAKGRAEGEAKAARQAVVLSAKRRFGSIPAAFEDKIQAITEPERFFEILDRILEVDSIEDVELD